jgi:hypothetical protein
VRCSLESLESVDVWGVAFLEDENARLEEFLAELAGAGGDREEGQGAAAGGVAAWQEQLDRQAVLTLAYEISAFHAPHPVYADPATGQQFEVVRSLRLKKFDLLSGALLLEQEFLSLQDGRVVGGELTVRRIETRFFESLPPGLQQALADAAARINR